MPTQWLKYGDDLISKPEVAILAEQLDLSLYDVCGRLMEVWLWVSRNGSDGQILFGRAENVTPESLRLEGRALFKCIDRAAGLDGFADAMTAVGWLVRAESSISVPHWGRHNSASARDRALGNLRVERHRAKKNDAAGEPKPETPTKRKCNHDTVSISSPEKKREDKKRESSSSSSSPPDVRSERPKEEDDDRVRAVVGERFEEAWSAWPSRRRYRKPACIEAWRDACVKCAEADKLEIGEAAARLAAEVRRFAQRPKASTEQCPGLVTFLREQRWQDDPDSWGRQRSSSAASGLGTSPVLREAHTEPSAVREARKYLRDIAEPDRAADTIDGMEAVLRMCASLRSDVTAQTRLDDALEQFGIEGDSQRDEWQAELADRRARRAVTNGR